MKPIYKLLLKIVLWIHNLAYVAASFLAIKLNDGVHPKHRILDYHKFFTENISSEDSVLDIGCGNGQLAFDIAKKAKSVFAIDMNKNYIEKAKRKNYSNNIEYVAGDAIEYKFNRNFDVIILSNVLEHIEKRVEFLNEIKKLASKFLIRVPMFDRDWLVPYKKENGVEWHLDKTHFIEYTQDSFKSELEKSGLKIQSLSVQFGEVWCVAMNNK